MHETMERLYKAAEELKGWRGQTEVARGMDAYPQTLNNWEARGMSKDGMLIAQEVIGCSSVWLKTGTGPMIAAPTWGPLSKDDQQTLAMADFLPPDELDALIESVKAAQGSKTTLLAKLLELRSDGESIEPPPEPPPEPPEHSLPTVKPRPAQLIRGPGLSKAKAPKAKEKPP